MTRGQVGVNPVHSYQAKGQQRKLIGPGGGKADQQEYA
jgi:hypothetical protein